MDNLELYQVGVIFAIGFANAFLIRIFSREQATTALIATVRSLIQLLLLGFALQLIFDNNSWPVKIFALCLMIFNGSYTLKKRATNSKEKLWVYFSIMFISTLPGVLMAYWLLDFTYFSKPFFIIPFVGMLVGNSLTGLTLGINGLYEDITRSKKEIIFQLSYNYTQFDVAKTFFRRSLKNGLTPILNLMLIVGIVSIPGLMTGQMMAGTSPFLSARYQYFLIIAIETTVIVCLLLYYLVLGIRMKTNEFYLMEIVDESH